MKSKYKRILLKVSGEGLSKENQVISSESLLSIVGEIKEALSLSVQVAIVVGGGNIFRGLSVAAQKVNRVIADQMGMLATVINALALKDALQTQGVLAEVQSASFMPSFCSGIDISAAEKILQQNGVVIFAGGTGNPFFSTDTASTLRALELGCDAFIKSTNARGIYDADPRTNPDAHLYETVSYREVLQKKLKVMDATAVALAEENKLPVIVFQQGVSGLLKEVLQGTGVCTVMQEKE